MYQLLNRCIRELFTNPDLKCAVDITLSHIGNYLGACRVYVALREADGAYYAVHEWHGNNTPSIKTVHRHYQTEKNIPQWLEAMKKDGYISVPDIGALRELNSGEDCRPGIKAFARFPIWQGNELYGYMAIDDRKIHTGIQEEAQMLGEIANLIAATLGRTRLQDDVGVLNKPRDKASKEAVAFIYVSDLKTYKIIYVNAKLQRLHNDSPLPGHICWKALQNLNEKCSYCPVAHLLNGTGNNYLRKFHSEALGKYFLAQDSIVSWVGGRAAYMQCAVDISGLQNIKIY